MKKKLIGLSVLAAGAAAALAASAVPGGGIPASSSPVSGITAQAEAYLTPDEAAEAGVATLIKQCLAKAGYDFSPPVYAPKADLNGAIGFARLDVATAKASGYASLGYAGPHEPAEDSDVAKLFTDPAFQAAYMGPNVEENMVKVDGSSGGTMGTPGGGCRGEAMKEIYGSVENSMLATGIAGNSMFVATRSSSSDPGFQKAIDSWNSCMSDSPYANYRSPSDAVTAGQEAGGQIEFKIAVTDATCREQVNFHGQLNAVLDKYLTTRMQQLEPEIAKVTEIRKHAAARATALSGK